MYRLQLKSKAQKDLDKLQGSIWQRVIDAIGELRRNPRPAGCKKIRVTGDAYRIRVGDYRVIYEVDDSAQLITVDRVRHRKDVYRGF